MRHCGGEKKLLEERHVSFYMYTQFNSIELTFGSPNKECLKLQRKNQFQSADEHSKSHSRELMFGTQK